MYLRAAEFFTASVSQLHTGCIGRPSGMTLNSQQFVFGQKDDWMAEAFVNAVPCCNCHAGRDL